MAYGVAAAAVLRSAAVKNHLRDMILTRPIQLHTLKMFQVIRSLLLNILVALQELLQLMMLNKEPFVLRERTNLFLTATFQVTHTYLEYTGEFTQITEGEVKPEVEGQPLVSNNTDTGYNTMT